jgi:excisionase family DNA binding protein
LLEEKVDKANREISELQKEIDELNISTATVYRMIQTGKLEARNFGAKKALRIPRSALDEFLERRRRAAEW